MGEAQDLRGYIEQLEGIAKAVVAKAGVSGANVGYALANVGVKVDELKTQLAAALQRAEDAERELNRCQQAGGLDELQRSIAMIAQLLAERDRLAAAVERVRKECAAWMQADTDCDSGFAVDVAVTDILAALDKSGQPSGDNGRENR